MTAGELIDELSKYPRDSNIQVFEGLHYMEIDIILPNYGSIIETIEIKDSHAKAFAAACKS